MNAVTNTQQQYYLHAVVLSLFILAHVVLGPRTAAHSACFTIVMALAFHAFRHLVVAPEL